MYYMTRWDWFWKGNAKDPLFGGSHALARLLTATLGISNSSHVEFNQISIWQFHLESRTMVCTGTYRYIPVHTMLWYITVWKTGQKYIQVYTGIYFFVNFTKSIYRYILVYDFHESTYRYILVYTFLKYMTVYDGIWRYIAVYDGISKYMKVHTFFNRGTY